MTRHGNYLIEAMTVKAFVPLKEKGRKKTNDKKPKSIQVMTHYVVLQHVTSGLVWAFTGTARRKREEDGSLGDRVLTFKDGREDIFDMGAKPVRLTPEQLESTLAKLLMSKSDAADIVRTMYNNTVKSEDAKDTLDAVKECAAFAKQKIKGNREMYKTVGMR